MTPAEISELLRRRIMADLHLGRLKPGGRLPSLRIVSRDLGVSIRTAARAYAELQREGLVTVRGRSGIYLAGAHGGELVLQKPLDWFAKMLGDAWTHRLTLNEVTNLLQQLVDNPLRVACVESTEDHMVAFCSELEDDFALSTKSVLLTPNGARVGDEVMSLPDAVRDVDFIVTTAFHASEVNAVADELNKPVVLISMNDMLVETIERHLASQPVMLVAEDKAFVDRFRTHLLERFRNSGELRIMRLDEVLENPAATEGSVALYTRAARRRLKGDERQLLPEPIPFLSAHAARKIVQCMLTLHGLRSLRAA